MVNRLSLTSRTIQTPAMTHDNGKAVTLGLSPSFGFGDRIGLATPGHVQALRAAGGPVRPIFPQQSIREMQRTGRTPAGVMADALAGMAQAGWDGPTGADADHLKTPDDVAVTTAAGFRFFTIDPSDAVDEHADRYDESTLRERYATVRDQVDWVADYRGRTVTLPGDLTLEFTEEACLRYAVKYGPALNRAADLAQVIRSRNAGRDYEIELSVDETEQPTTLVEHYVIADQCRRRGVPLVALAPRYLGDFEKGVDYKGDGPTLERSLRRQQADHRQQHLLARRTRRRSPRVAPGSSRRARPPDRRPFPAPGASPAAAPPRSRAAGCRGVALRTVPAGSGRRGAAVDRATLGHWSPVAFEADESRRQHDDRLDGQRHREDCSSATGLCAPQRLPVLYGGSM